MVLRHYLLILRRRWTLILAGVLIAIIAALGVHALTPPTYEASVGLLVGQGAYTDDVIRYTALLADEQVAKTYAELATSRPVLEAVNSKLQLNMTPDQLAMKVKVKLLPETRLIEVVVSDTSPQRAADIANAIGEQINTLAPTKAPAEYQSIREQISEEIKSLRDRIRSSEADLAAMTAQSNTALDPAPESSELVRRREVLREAITAMQTTLASMYTAYQSSLTTNSVTVVAPALPPTTPVGFGLSAMLAIAGILGLAAATGIVILLETLDDVVRSPYALRRAARTPFLGIIPKFDGDAAKAGGLVVMSKPRSAAAEAFRSLRATLKAGTAGEPPRSILVTSSKPGEGKTLTAANLAVTLARLRKRVVLVDTDLRHPRLHTLFGVSNHYGLSNLLSTTDPMQFITDTKVPNLRLLPAGAPLDDPGELLLSDRMLYLLEFLRYENDFIILDTPPVIPVTDAAVVAPLADEVLLVVGSGRVKHEELANVLDGLTEAGAKKIGVVLTNADMNMLDYRGTYARVGSAAETNGAFAQLSMGNPVRTN